MLWICKKKKILMGIGALFLFLEGEEIYSREKAAKEEVKKIPRVGNLTEFHKKPSPFGFFLYFTGSFFPAEELIKKRGDLSASGLGLLTLFYLPSSFQWIGHKFFYLSFSLEYTSRASRVYLPTGKDPSYRDVFSFSQGIYVRSYLPFALKIFTGGGFSFQWGKRKGEDYLPPASLFMEIGIQFPLTFIWEVLDSIGFSSIFYMDPEDGVYPYFRIGWFVIQPFRWL